MSAVGPIRRVDETPSQAAVGASNLSERIPSQVEWALARLSLYTQQLGDRFILSEYPGLDESLLRLIKRLSLALQGDLRETWDQDPSELTSSNFVIDQGIGAPGENGGTNLAMSYVKFSNPSQKVRDPDRFSPLSVKRDAILLKHAAAAALVLRNIALSQANTVQLSLVPGILRVLCTVIDAMFSADLPSDPEIYADLRVNLLDILEPLASRIQLSDWVRHTYGCVEEVANDTCSPTEGDRLFALLHGLLHTTNDRALLLASLRCLRAISTNEENATQLLDATPLLEPTRLGITSRCLALLPLTQDPELLEAALDLLYQVAKTGDNALLLGSLRVSDICDQGYAMGLSQRAFQECDGQQDSLVVVAVIDYLARNLGLGKTVWERDSIMTKNTTAPWVSSLLSPAELRLRKEHSKRTRKEQASPQERMRWKELTASELDQLKRLDEPLRGTEWMKLLYECDPHGEVTQMEFWIAYRDQFTPIAAEGGVALQPAANLIRTVSQTFPGASAMVIPSTAGAQPRFIIRGISQRDRSIPQIQCCWEACPAPDVDSYHTVQKHLKIHTDAAHDQACRWRNCAYELPSTSLQKADLLYKHALTHLPSSHTTKDTDPSRNAQDTQELITFTVERTPSVPNSTPGEAPLPCGAAYLSALVLRFITRSSYDVLILTGQGCPSYTYGGPESSVPRHADREEKFGCPIPRSDQDAMQDIAQQTPTYGPQHIHAAKVIMESVTSTEELFVQSSSRNDILCRLINDILVTIRPVEDS